jgi:hypothetical protein
MPRVAVTELALDHDQRHALARELNGVRLPELVGRKAPPDAGVGGGVVHVCSCGGARPGSATGPTVDDAEQRPDGHLHA